MFILHLPRNRAAASSTNPNSLVAACCRVNIYFYCSSPCFINFLVVSVDLVLLVVKLLVVKLLAVVLLVIELLVVELLGMPLLAMPLLVLSCCGHWTM